VLSLEYSFRIDGWNSETDLSLPLHTLQIGESYVDSTQFLYPEWELPSLCHLAIRIWGAIEEDRYLPFVQRYCPQLQSLNFGATTYSNLPRLLDACSSLRDLSLFYLHDADPTSVLPLSVDTLHVHLFSNHSDIADHVISRIAQSRLHRFMLFLIKIHTPTLKCVRFTDVGPRTFDMKWWGKERLEQWRD
jgi:hypothetical protein